VSVVLLRGDARELPLADNSCDLIVTSPPYWSLRDYRDGDRSLEGQIGSEATPREYVAALLECTREWARVLKPTGSMFINLGDKYANDAKWGGATSGKHVQGLHGQTGVGRAKVRTGAQPKSLIGLPWRYALGCMDDLGLILRRDIIWHKTNPLPESTADRCATRHEYLFHLVKEPRYYSAVDEIREETCDVGRKPKSVRAGPLVGAHGSAGHDGNGMRMAQVYNNPLGKMPGSVWEIPSQPLMVPGHLDLDQHFAAFPMELPRRCILGWSPAGICLACSEGRFPVVNVATIEDRKGRKQRIVDLALDGAHGPDGRGGERWRQFVRITGYACSCTPYTDHPERRGRDFHAGTDRALQGMNDGNGGERFRRYMEELESPRGPVREYHFDRWVPAPTRPAVVLDPYGGTGTTALVADALGRGGVSVDLSAGYCRTARWRCTNPGERAKALQVPKPPPVIDGQESLFEVGA
jgi:DNA modification methylase